ncbi:MAG: hypothetical protein KIT11_05500 [Fimbriimonadaceae bacterium]|nr:hypothetical protein [Fimbriimonadaceae bacterium]QYK56652.1 MAG: hypothetical protein KF733_04020 [Fimbriimonadaceae bacterium]
MRKLLTLSMFIAAIALAVPGCDAQSVQPVVDVSYTASGRTYVSTAVGFGERPIGKSIAWDYGLVAAFDTETRKPATGLGVWAVWRDPRSPLTARVGVYGLAQAGRPTDVSVGFSVGARI